MLTMHACSSHHACIAEIVCHVTHSHNRVTKSTTISYALAGRECDIVDMHGSVVTASMHKETFITYRQLAFRLTWRLA